MNELWKFLQGLFGGSQVQAQIPTSQPTPTSVPKFTVDKYLRQQANGAPLEQYYPAYPAIATESANLEKQYNKPGTSDLNKLMAFFESTMGRNVGKPFNYYGMAPQSNQFQGYNNDIQAIDRWGQHLSGQTTNSYFSPILKNNPGQPITSQDIIDLYTAKPGEHGSYNPGQAYLKPLLDVWKQLGYQ